jgi:hypothetical protein
MEDIRSLGENSGMPGPVHPLDDLQNHKPSKNEIDALLHKQILDEVELNESILSEVKINNLRDHQEINSSEEDEKLDKYLDDIFNPTQNVSDYINNLGDQIVKQRSKTRNFS